MKYTIDDQKTCIAYWATAPELFDYREGGISFAVLDNNKGLAEVPEELDEDLEDAAEGCPTTSTKVAAEPFLCPSVQAG